MIIKDEMEKTLGDDSVTVEEFTCAPEPFIGWFKYGVGIAVVSLISHFLATKFSGIHSMILSAIAFILAALIIVIAWFEFVYVREFIDFMFKKKKSENFKF